MKNQEFCENRLPPPKKINKGLLKDKEAKPSKIKVLLGKTYSSSIPDYPTSSPVMLV